LGEKKGNPKRTTLRNEGKLKKKRRRALKRVGGGEEICVGREKSEKAGLTRCRGLDSERERVPSREEKTGSKKATRLLPGKVAKSGLESGEVERKNALTKLEKKPRENEERDRRALGKVSRSKKWCAAQDLRGCSGCPRGRTATIRT